MRGPTVLSLLFTILTLAPAAGGRPRTNFSLASLVEQAREDLVSRSMGKASEGRIAGDVSLPPTGPGWRRVPVVKRRGTHYGAAPLIRLLRSAAAATALLHPGAVLNVANISRRGGGPVAQSRSHQGGRDADVAFYFVDDRGRPDPPGRLVSCDDQGRAGERRLDAAATWTFTRTMLASEGPVVQWMFCSKGVKRLLLDEARRRREPAWLTRRAASVLHQPSDSQPHDDHFHIRIFCGREDRLAGCVDYGPSRAWAPDWDDAVDRRAADLSRAVLATEDPWGALDLLKALAPLGAPATFSACRTLLGRDDTGPRTQALSLETLGSSGEKDDLERMRPFLTNRSKRVRDAAAAGMQALRLGLETHY